MSAAWESKLQSFSCKKPAHKPKKTLEEYQVEIFQELILKLTVSYCAALSHIIRLLGYCGKLPDRK